MRTALAIIAAVLIGCWSPPAAAQNVSLEDALAAIAKEVAGKIKDLNTQAGISQNEVNIGVITSAASLGGGPRIAQDLATAISALDVKVTNTDRFSISGQLSRAQSSGSQLTAIIEGSLFDRTGLKILEFHKEGILEKTTDTAAFLAPTVNLPPKATVEERVEAFVSSLEKPKVALPSETQARSSPDSKYGVEIWVQGPDGKFSALPITDRNGQAFVDLKRGQAFAIRLVNDDREYDAAAYIAIDGLSHFAFSKNKGYEYLVFPKAPISQPPEDLLIKGWHIRNDKAEQFVVTSYEHSAVAQASADQSKVGTITVSFAAAWDPKDPQPQDEPTLFTTRGNATGRGPAVEQQLKEVVRRAGRVRSIVTIRYDRAKASAE